MKAKVGLSIAIRKYNVHWTSIKQIQNTIVFIIETQKTEQIFMSVYGRKDDCKPVNWKESKLFIKSPVARAFYSFKVNKL